MHLAAVVLPRAERTPSETRWLPLAVGSCGLGTMLGFFAYYGYLVITEAAAVGPLLAGRPVLWVGLQLLALTACVLTALLSVTWWRRGAAPRLVPEKHSGAVVLAGVALVAWAAYWGLLVP